MNDKKSSNTVWHMATVTRERREKLNKHKSVILWFTGLSGSGKSTVAHSVEEQLHQMGCKTFVFDGDNVRQGLCGDLGFSDSDRKENLRRIGEMVKLFLEAGTISLTAFISPFKESKIASICATLCMLAGTINLNKYKLGQEAVSSNCTFNLT